MGRSMMCGAQHGVQPPLYAMKDEWVNESWTTSGLNGRIGPGPTHVSQSRPGGGSQFGSLPIPSAPRFKTLKVRATLIGPRLPERTWSTTLW